MFEVSFTLKKGVKFDIARITDKIKTDYPTPANPQPTDLYFTGAVRSSSTVDLDKVLQLTISITMSIKPDGWKAEDNGSHTTASAAETLQAYFDGLDETSDESTKNLTNEEKRDVISRAKADAASKTWDQMSASQRKVAMNAAIELADWDQLVIDFPGV